MPYVRHYGCFVPKNRFAINRSSPLGEIRRFENVVVDLEDKASEKCCKSIASSLWYFLEKSFRVPKVVAKITCKIRV